MVSYGLFYWRLVHRVGRAFVKLQCVKIPLPVEFFLVRSATVLLNCVVFCIAELSAIVLHA